MSDAATTPGEGSTHGFLFADLRGYQLVDTHGAVHATHLLEDGPRTLTVVYAGRAEVLPAFETGLGRRLLASIVLRP